MKFEATASFAQSLDEKDSLKNFRKQFHFPKHNGRDSIYFTGNSLGLQPKTTEKYILEELADWREFGVEGHFKSKRPWFGYHHFLTEKAATLVGALPIEVVVMNTLTVNLNLLMLSFYQPKGKRSKILIEDGPFPSDYYAVEQLIRLKGLNPAENILELKPRSGEYVLRKEDILQTIDQHRDELAMIMMGGVNYYTGQLFDMKAIREAARKASPEIKVGFDLAHAAGNVLLNLHDWDIDFACWCSYKYLNSGPGGSSGAFVHERHSRNPELPRLAGWWGNDEKTRFKMPKNFVPQEGAAGWQMSNAQVLPMAAHLASLEIFHEAGMPALREKSILLTAYCEYLIRDVIQEKKLDLQIITPPSSDERGCQLSMLSGADGRKWFDRLTAEGVVADWREPNVIRIAPVPLYNSFEDVYRFYEILRG